MSTFPLQIGTPDGLLFEGDVARVVCRSITGDLAILAGYCNFCTALGMGEAHVVMEDGTRVRMYDSSRRFIGLYEFEEKKKQFRLITMFCTPEDFAESRKETP